MKDPRDIPVIGVAEADAWKEADVIQTSPSPSPVSGRDQDAPSGWQPIETAPRDGTRILIYVPSERLGVCEAWWKRPFEAAAPEHCWWKTLDYELLPEQPTHWMPLPEPPK